MTKTDSSIHKPLLMLVLVVVAAAVVIVMKAIVAVVLEATLVALKLITLNFTNQRNFHIGF